MEWEKAPKEQRQAEDGTFYTWDEFVNYYGVSAWEKFQKANKRAGRRYKNDEFVMGFLSRPV